MKLMRAQVDGLIFLTLGIFLFLALGLSILRSQTELLQDFKIIYYSTRTLLQHHDPYVPANVLLVYLAETGTASTDAGTISKTEVVTYSVYFPSTFLAIAPFAMLPWGPAHVVWDLAVALSLTLAAIIVWRRSCYDNPAAAGLLAGLLLVDFFPLLWVANAAGLAVGLGILAACCFLEERFVPAGIVFLAVALMIKPHDVWLIWFYFILADNPGRRYALRTLALTLILSIAAVTWAWSVAPAWLHELQSNLRIVSGPSASVLGARTAGMFIDLQTAFSVFCDNPRFYNTASYVLVGTLIVLWTTITWNAPVTRATSSLALAAAVPLMLLPTYHRVWDASLLLLTVPAAVMLWKRHGPVRWLSLLLNGIAVCMVSPFVLAGLVSAADRLQPTTSTLPGKFLTLALGRPIPLLLLALALFYLTVYIREVRVCPNVTAQPAS